MQPSVSLRLLGQFAATHHNQTVKLRTGKAQALLAYVACYAPQPIRREQLATLLWSEQDNRTALTNLRSELSKLRKVLPDCLTVTRQTVALASPIDCDVTKFDHALAHCRDHIHAAIEQCEACVTYLNTIADLYRGEFLAGLSLNGADGFEMWRIERREALHREWVWLLTVLLAHAEFVGEDVQVVQAATQLLGVEAWHEGAQRALIAAQLRQGDRVGAQAQYEQFAQLLASEFGATPSVETQALLQIEGARPAAQQTIQHNLPQSMTPFFGRNQELHNLTDADHRLITIVGVGGVGKTRLALSMAHKTIWRFPDGVYFVPLGHFVEQADSVEDDLIDAIAEQLNLRYGDKLTPKQQVFDFLRDRHALLILDNLEQFEQRQKRNFILDLLAAAPQLRIVATSRHRLRTQAEVLVHLDGLAVPTAPNEDDWQAYPALQLLWERARRISGDFRYSPNNLPHAIDICQQVQGLPLGIELAATWLEHFTLQEIASEMRQDREFLSTEDDARPERHSSLRAVFDYSWRLLSAEQQTLLAQLSVFSGAFGREAAQAVTGTRLAKLIKLVDKSLLTVADSGRYVLHPVVWGFSAEKCVQLNLTKLTKMAHSRYYLNWLGAQYDSLYGDNLAAQIQTIRRERDNIQQAWLHAVEQQHFDSLLTSIEALSRFCKLASLYREAVELFLPITEQLIAAPSAATQPLLFALLPKLMAYLNRRRDYATVIDIAERGLQLNPPPQVAAGIQCELGMAYWNQWQLPLAEQHLQRALALIEQPASSTVTINNQQIRANTLRGLGLTAYRQVDYAAAQSYFDQALTLAEAAGDRLGKSHALGMLAAIARNQGTYERSEHYLSSGLAIAQELGDERGAGTIANSLGDVAFYRGHYDAALAHYQHSMTLHRSVGARVGEATVRNNLGTLAAYVGDYAQSEEHFRAARLRHQQLGYARGEAWSLANLGLLFHRQGETATALRYAQQGFELFNSIDDRVGAAYAGTWLGHVWIAKADYDLAQVIFSNAATALAARGHDYLLMETHAGRAEVALQRNQPLLALQHVEVVLSFLERRTLDGSYRPNYIHHICYRTLIANSDPRADHIQQRAHNDLHTRATHINTPTLRTQFLQTITHNHPEFAQPV